MGLRVLGFGGLRVWGFGVEALLAAVLKGLAVGLFAAGPAFSRGKVIALGVASL